MNDNVRVNDRHGVRHVHMHRPDKKNALSTRMYTAMARALTEAETAQSIGAVLVSAEGSIFTAGNDLHDFLENPPCLDSPVFAFLEALARSSVPIVAAVPGPAIGIGTTMLLHFEITYASPDARFSLPFVDLGLVCEAGSSLLLPRKIGPARAARMLLLGESLDAQEALDSGLVTAIVPADELLERAHDAAQRIAARPRAAVRETKRLLRGDTDALLCVMRREAQVVMERLSDPETRERMLAVLERRRI